jgi:hypothetical protein
MPLSVSSLLHPALAAANFAASGIYPPARFGWLFGDFKTGAIAGFAFDFEFV